MFEVGKKYRNPKLDTLAAAMECVAVGEGQACLKNPEGQFTIRYDSDFKDYQEYKEPVKHARYFNVYKDIRRPEMRSYLTRQAADCGAGTARIGCVRVEFTEGTYDD